MQGENLTSWSFFFLEGFSRYPKLEIVLFVFSLIMHLITLLGNSTLNHYPRFMPSNSHVLVPWKSLFHGYLLHICFYSHFAGELAVIPENHHLFWVCCTDVSVPCSGLQEQCLLLAVMAYDHYVAICKPLRYPVIMNRQVCVQMATVSWVRGSLTALLETSFTLQIPLWEFHPSRHV